MTDQPVQPPDAGDATLTVTEGGIGAGSRLSQVELDRRTKLAAWRDKGHAYPNDFHRDTEAHHLHEVYGGQDAAALEGVAERFAVAGRLMAKRVMGKASFGTLQDATGRIQLFAQANTLGPEAYEVFKTADVGDILGVNGRIFRTKTGELSVWAESLVLLTKNLRPLPEKWAGLTDTETRYRQRYVDLAVNPEVMEVFKKRSRIIATLRRYLDAIGYQEVETPMLQPIPGGATAKPFVTHHNALDHAFYLRIAPELYLKRLVVGGFEKVYEINRNFRNEGLSTRHNPEFTMLEFYEAYADYARMMDRVEDMVRDCHYAVGGGPTHPYQGRDVDMESPFARMTMREAVAQYNPEVDAARLLDADYLREVCREKKIAVKASFGAGKLLTEVFEATVEGSLFDPTFITEYPTEVSPLARANDDNPLVTDRFEFFLGGREIANGFSELNDPEDQAARFHAQVAAKDAGDDEAMFYDHDYIRALEVGMPPAGGAGVGVDRLVMFLTDAASIRDVLLFPQMRPEAV